MMDLIETYLHLRKQIHGIDDNAQVIQRGDKFEVSLPCEQGFDVFDCDERFMQIMIDDLMGLIDTTNTD